MIYKSGMGLDSRPADILDFLRCESEREGESCDMLANRQSGI